MTDSFTGKYAFLSNFYPYRIMFDEYYWPSTENAYQAMKTPADKRIQNLEWNEFQICTPGQAKKLGKRLPLRADWDQVKDATMYAICFAKFQGRDIGEQLLLTGDEELIEGNTWGDTYWGVCDGVGQNKLGKILMNIRYQLKLNKNQK